MKSWFFQFGMLAFGGAALLMWGPWSVELPSVDIPDISGLVSAGGFSDAEPPVEVVLIENRDSIEAIRSALKPEHVVAATEDAFATADGRVYAVSIASATAPINQAGWSSRPIQFVDAPGGGKPTFAQHEAAEAARDAETAASDVIGSLKHKDELTSGESLKLLKEMERRGDL